MSSTAMLEPTLEPVKKPVRRYGGLQVLRVMCAFAVLIVHNLFYSSERLTHQKSYWAPHFGEVDIFFVLSGFVLISSSEYLFRVPRGWRIFAERRFARVVPMYWLATTLKVVALLAAGRYVLHATLVPSKVALSYLFLPSLNKDHSIEPLLGVAWTLLFEIFFYVLFMVALYLRLNIYKFFGTVAILLWVGSIFRRPDWPTFCFYLSPLVLECFAGMLIARACQKGKILGKGLAICSVLVGMAVIQAFPAVSPVPQIVRLGLPAALIVYAVASLEEYLTRIPKFLLFLAQASYSVYLFHPLVAPVVPELFARHHAMHLVGSTAGGVALALAVGSLVHWFLEKPANDRIQTYLKRRPNGMAAAGLPATRDVVHSRQAPARHAGFAGGELLTTGD